MSRLYLNKNKIESVFQLLGEQENDMSYSLAWALAQCPQFLRKFISAIVGKNNNINPEDIEVSLQKHTLKSAEGITDIELKSPPLFNIIVEAKRGYNWPTKKQLRKYAERLNKENVRVKRLAILSEFNKKNAPKKIKEVNGVPIKVVSWKEAVDFAKQTQSYSSHAQKRLIKELITYFKKIMKPQNYDSNRVYVVALNTGKPKEWRMSPIDTVKKTKRYFHPIGENWPKEPLNYIAFRYNGKLQSIHHIENYEATRKLGKWLTKNPPKELYLYTLGPAIKPSKEIKTGKLYASQHVWCMLDTLLTSKTIAEARDISKKRKEGF